jgi:hypothetical protein
VQRLENVVERTERLETRSFRNESMTWSVATPRVGGGAVEDMNDHSMVYCAL